VKLAAAARSLSVTMAITYDDLVGTSICDRAARTSSRPRAIDSVGANAARINATLDGMCVNTIVLTSPMRRESRAATGNENADATPDQKKKAPASDNDRSKRSNNQSASKDCTTNPPAKASRLNSAARWKTRLRDGPSA